MPFDNEEARLENEEPPAKLQPGEEVIPDMPPLSIDEFPTSFVSTITGSRGSGKTVCCEALLNEMMDGPKSKRRFDTVFLFSSTMSPANFHGIPNNYKWVTMDVLPEIVRRQAGVTQYNKALQIKRKKGHSTEPYIRSSICLVLDDMLATGSLRGPTAKLLISIALNGRHVNATDPEPYNQMCTFILTQSITGIDPCIRRNVDVALCNRISNRNDRRTYIESGMIVDSSKQGFTNAFHCFDKVTTTAPFAMCALLNYEPNKRKFGDFVRTFVAPKPPKKAKRLFGKDEDFRSPLPSVDITDYSA